MDSDIIYDLTQPLSPDTPVYPGDKGIDIEILGVAEEPSDGCSRSLNNSRIALGLHNGTHIDACFHFFNDRPTIDQANLQRCCGSAAIIDVSRTRKRGVIDPEDLQPYQEIIAQRPVTLLFSGWDKRWGKPGYFDEHPIISEAAASCLVSWGSSLVGVDFPSVDREPFEAHLVFLSNNVLIVENLANLQVLKGKDVVFYALPLSIVGRDASPVRAIAIEKTKKDAQA